MQNSRDTKRYACFSEEQQAIYSGLTRSQQAYVLLRGRGYSATEAYKMAGYQANNANQKAYLLEKREHPEIQGLISALAGQKGLEGLEDPNSDINKLLDDKAKEGSNVGALAVINGADGETARRIQFYRNIINGKIRSVKTLEFYNKNGQLISSRKEYIDDVDTRMKARKELDRILGLHEVVDVGALKMGDITINIVDASKKEELADDRNKVVLEDSDIKVKGEDPLGEESGEQ